MSTLDGATIVYDPYAPDIRENPYPLYRYLRDEAPLYRNPEKGFFVVSRFADVLETLYDFETYKSGEGITLTTRRRDSTLRGVNQSHECLAHRAFRHISGIRAARVPPMRC